MSNFMGKFGAFVSLTFDLLRINRDKASPINLDGELRMAQVVDFKVADEKLRFFYPKGLVWRMKETVCSK